MQERQAAQSRVTQLLEEDEKAVPYIVGYLTAYLDTETIVRAVDSWLEHDEKITAMVEAARQARLHPGTLQE